MLTVAYIGIGSNLGDREANCRKAVAMLGRLGTVTRVSSFYRAAPVGNEDQGEFLNAAAELTTDLAPRDLLREAQAIEAELGRTREARWGPRTIDLDLLLYGDRVVHDRGPELVVPHPLLPERRFVLVPLAEIAPQAVHPGTGRTIAQLLNETRDRHRVEPYRPQRTEP